VPDDVKKLLAGIYDRAVAARERRAAPAWEDAERDDFLRRLREEGGRSLLELGAATGADAAFFAGHGLAVTCVDLSPEMVRRCRARGLEAHVMDVSALRLPDGSFDAAYARNCLVHVPADELDATLAGIARVLRQGGLFHLALYGGRPFEGIWEGDTWEPKRFFSFHTDEALRERAERVFDLESFRRIEQGFGGQHYQALVLRKPRPNVHPASEGPR
jgi:SAM-dependent methyltransferase